MNKEIELLCSNCEHYVIAQNWCIRSDVICLVDNIPLRLNPARERLGIHDNRPVLNGNYETCDGEAKFFKIRSKKQLGQCEGGNCNGC